MGHNFVMRRVIIGINLGDFGSTGNMMRNALEYAAEKLNCEYLVIVPNGCGLPHTFSFEQPYPAIHKFVENHNLLRRLRVPEGLYYRLFSRRVIDQISNVLEAFDKVVVHLHNLHHTRLDLPYLLAYLNKQAIPVFYTLHDCWQLTGGCYHYDAVPCSRWKDGCRHCPAGYPHATHALKAKTKNLLLSKNMMLMPCSNWLDRELKKSVLGGVTSEVIYGETSLSRGRPNPFLKEQLGIPIDNRIVISVSAYWNEWKGADFIYDVAKRLPDNYTLLIVGPFDTKDFSNILSVGLISNDRLSEYYQISDCFVSVTQCETLGLVIPEAQICGLPVVGFGHGGTPEAITKKSGIMVGTDNNVDKLVHAIVYVCEHHPFAENDIVEAGNRFGKYEYAKRMLPFYVRALGIDSDA